jgi:hypothetical protein
MRGVECACKPGTCNQQPKAIALPPIRPTNQDILFVSVFCIVIALIAGQTYHALDRQEHQFQLEARI